MTSMPSVDSSPSGTSAVLRVEQGLPGFPDLSQLTLAPIDEYGIFVWLLAPAPHELAFLAVNPFVYFPRYEVELTDADQVALEVAAEDELIVYCLVTVNDDQSEATANLLAPVVVNATRGVARQLILEHDLDLRAPLPVPRGIAPAELAGKDGQS